MSTTPTPKVPAFLHRGPEESICLECFATVRPQAGQKLDAAEQWHRQECVCALVGTPEGPQEDFAHREIRPGVIEVLCLRCLTVAGTATTPKAAGATAKGHRCKDVGA